MCMCVCVHVRMLYMWIVSEWLTSSSEGCLQSRELWLAEGEDSVYIKQKRGKKGRRRGEKGTIRIMRP